MCDINRENLEDYISEIETNIKRCDFLAVDTEFTGLHSSRSVRPSLFDAIEERYRKLRVSAQKIVPSQIGVICATGVSVFVRDQSAVNSRYVAHSYNFYLFPASMGPIDVRFQCQSSSLEFLVKHNFDFNKFVYGGVSFMNRDQEKRLLDYLSNEGDSRGVDRDIDEAALQTMCSSVAGWLAKDDSTHMEIDLDRDLDEFVVISELRTRFPQIWAESKNGKVSVTKVSSSERDKLLQETRLHQVDKTIKTMLGFTRVFRAIVASQKPLVAHNCFMDLLLLYDKCHSYLPVKYNNFKTELHSILPHIYDTKSIASVLRKEFEESKFFEKTSLGELYQSLTGEQGIFYYLYSPDVSHADECSRYKDNFFPHEAGYDAFMCGRVFLQCAHLAASRNIKSTDARPLSLSELLSAVQAEKNRVNLTRASIQHMQLDGADPVGCRPQWLYVKSLAGSLKPIQLAHLFSPHGSVDIQMQSTKQALVAVANYSSSRAILKAFRKNELVYVTSYRTWKHSPLVRNLLLAGLAVSGSVCLWSLFSSRHK